MVMPDQSVYQQLLELSLCSTEVLHQQGFSLFIQQMGSLVKVEYATILFQKEATEVAQLQHPLSGPSLDYAMIDTLLGAKPDLQVNKDSIVLSTFQQDLNADHVYLFRLKHEAIFVLYTKASPLFEKEPFIFFKKILDQVSHSLYQHFTSPSPFISPSSKDLHDIESPEEENYELIVNNISDGIIILDLKGEITFVNERMCEISGYPHSEILGQHVSNVLPTTEMAPSFLEKVKLAFSGEAAIYELNHFHKITQKPWRALVKGRPYFKDEQIAGAIGIISDITEIQNTEKALKESEERYRMLFENGFDGIILFDRYLNRPVSCNNRVLEYLGCTEEAFLKASPLDFSPEFQRNGQSSKKYRDQLLSTLDKSAMVRYEWNHIHSSGALLDTEVSIFPLPPPNDNIQIAILKDITERKQNLQALKEGAERLSMALDAGQLGTWEWNIMTGETIYNARWAEMLGYQLEEIAPNDKSFDKLVHPNDFKLVQEAVRRHIEGETPFFEVEIRMISKSGEIKWIYDRGKVTQVDESGQPLRASGIHIDLTERRKYEVELRQNEKLFRNYFEFSPFGIAIRKAEDQKFTRVNNKMAELFGYTKEELLLIDRNDLVFEEDFEIVDQKMRQLINREISSFSVEKRYRRKNGKTFWAVATRSLVVQDDYTYILGFVQDISERKVAEATLFQSQARLREAQRLARLGNWEFDLNTRKIDWSEETYHIMGYDLRKPAPDFQTYLKSVHPDDQSKLNTALDEMISKGESYELELRHHTSNDRLIYTLCTGKPLYQNQKIVKIFGTIQDVTERKITDHALRETTEKYIDLFENMNDALILINKEGYFVDANKAAQNLLGYPLAELSKLKIIDIVYKEDIQKSGVYLQKLLKDRAYKDYQGRIVTKGGEIKYLQVNSNAILDDAGNFIGSRDLARDITELKIAEHKRENLLIELEEVNQELKEFAYVVSHDLKAPLRAISSLAQWLSEDYKDKIDEDGQQQLQLLTQRVSRMHNFIEGILEYSRIGRIKVDKEEVDLNALIKDIHESLQPPAHFNIEVVSPLPKVYAERIRMEQLFQNLISNAIKYNDKEKGWVKISYEEQADFHIFRLQDNGCGIEEKYFNKIFQIFQTLQARDKFESTGIGLTIVKRIVQLYGGEITLHSKPPEGTTFEFSLKK